MASSSAWRWHAALVNRPAVLLLDEPLGALDRKLRQEMQIELKLLQVEVGITFVFVTHDQEEALSMSDRIAVMLEGHVEQLADPDTVYDEPASAFVAGFIGQNNFFPGVTDATGRGLHSDGCAIIATRSVLGVIGSAGGIAAVRPEAIDVTADELGPGVNRVEGVLAGTSHLGDVIQFVVRIGDREVLSRRPRHRTPKLQPGQRVWCQWDESQVHLFPDTQVGLVLADPAGEVASA